MAALKGDQVEMSSNTYIYVREGVPSSPTELVFYKENKSSISYQLNWKTKNPENVDGYLILVAYENETVAIETSHTTYRFDGVLPENTPVQDPGKNCEILTKKKQHYTSCLVNMIRFILSYCCKMIILAHKT